MFSFLFHQLHPPSRSCLSFLLHLECWGVEQGVHAEGHVGRVRAVVVGNVPQIVLLQGQQQGQQVRRRDLERAYQVSFLEHIGLGGNG